MKNLFVILAILAMVAFASAGVIQLQASKTQINIGETITISIVAPTTELNGGTIADQILTSNLAAGTAQSVSLNSGLTLLPQPGTIVNAAGVLVSGVGGSINIGSPSIAAGTAIWSMTFKGLAQGSATISASGIEILDPAENVYDSIDPVTINVVPEPMTIALLGLGGLFLRRKLS